MTVVLILACGAGRKQLFEKAQTYIDSECIRLMRPLVPVAKKYWHNAGRLRDSARNPTPGRIEYTAPFARHDYYATVDHRHGGNPAAQRMWFEHMKMRDAPLLLRGAAAIVGGRTRR